MSTWKLFLDPHNAIYDIMKVSFHHFLEYDFGIVFSFVLYPSIERSSSPYNIFGWDATYMTFGGECSPPFLVGVTHTDL